MNNQIQLVLKSSTTELSLNDHELGIYLTPELDGLTGLPEIRTTSGVNAGYDGGWTSAQNYDARSITIRGVIANENVATVEQLRRQLTTLAGQGKNEELTLDLVTQGGKAYTIQVRTIALEMALQKVLCQQEFMLQLRADDPLIYDGGSSGESVIVQVQKAIGGFQINFELPLAISGGSGESTINNGGLEQVYPIIKMYGALHNPTFVNQTTNQQFEVNATLGFAEGAWHTPSELYEGTTINIPDAPDNAPLASFQLDGETSQNGTPTPDAPVAVNTTTGENVVKIAGKNILNTDNTVGEQTQGGVTASMSGSVISIDGEGMGADGSTSGMNRTWALTTQIPLAAGTYSISGTLLSGSWTAAAQSRLRSIRINLSSGTYKEVSASNGSTALAGNTFTLTEATNVVGVQIMVYGQVKFYDAEFGLQLESGSATAYEPYQGQSYEVNLGKNLLDMATLVPGYVNGSNGTITVSQTQGEMCSGFIKVEPSTKYTVSIAETSSTYAPWFGIGEYTAADTSTFIRRQANTTTPTSYTITTHSTAQYVRVSGRNFADATKIQFEKWPSPTDYAAYFTPIELCKIGDYQDYIWKDGDTWKVHKACDKVVFNGVEGWSKSGSRFVSPSLASSIKPTTSNSEVAKISSDKFNGITINNTTQATPIDGIAIASSGNVVIYYGAMKDNTYQEFKTWLGTNNVIMYYQLATPTDTAITNSALIAQLEAVLGGHTYAGVNNIFTITPNEQGTLEISYMTEKDADKRDVMVIDSRMRTVTLNGADIYHLITAGSEFPMLAPGENKLLLRSDTPGDNGYADVNYKQGYLTI